MKKIIYLLIVLGAVVTGCNPLEDINNEIDAVPNPVVGTDIYTLTSEDYTNLVEQEDGAPADYYEMNENFIDIDDAKAMIPGFLANKYDFWGEGSAVDVGFNLFVGDEEGVNDFITSDTYNVQDEQYPGFAEDIVAYNVDETPEDFLPAILDAEFTTPIEGQLALATFEQFTETPFIGIANKYEAVFPGDFSDFELVSVSGPDELGWTEGATNVQGSAFNGSSNALEEWLISPEIDLVGESDLLFQITQEIDLFGADPALIDIMISTDYTTNGDVMTATWTALAFDKNIFGDLTTSEDIDLSAYDGETIHVGFKYSATDSASPRWRIQDFAIRNVGIEGNIENLGQYYTYSGSEWELTEGVYYLSSADYDSMGEESGQPGRFDNFSSSTPQENYLPTFLDIKFPFAQEDDEIYMIYRFFNGSTILQGNLYTYTNGTWAGDTDVIATNLKFGFKDGVWVPDNTIRYTLVGDDYNYMSGQLITEPGFEDAADNMGFFGSFTIEEENDNTWSPEMLLTAFDILLDNNDPSAEEEQKYILTFKVFDGSGVGNQERSLIKEGGEWIINTEE